MMELGFGGINACPENSEKNIYLFRDYMWKDPCKLSKEKMRVTTWSGIATGKTVPPIVPPQWDNRKNRKQLKLSGDIPELVSLTTNRILKENERKDHEGRCIHAIRKLSSEFFSVNTQKNRLVLPRPRAGFSDQWFGGLLSSDGRRLLALRLLSAL